MVNHDVNFDNRQVMHQEIITFNALMLGAFAWRGYQLKSTGAVVVDGLNERNAFLAQSINTKINYISKEEAIQIYPEAIGLFQLLDEYEPNNEMVVTFVCPENSMIDSYHLTLEIPLIQCFVLLQEQLISL